MLSFSAIGLMPASPLMHIIAEISLCFFVKVRLRAELRRVLDRNFCFVGLTLACFQGEGVGPCFRMFAMRDSKAGKRIAVAVETAGA